MSRTYSAIHHGCLTKPKFRRLSPSGRGALLTTWLLAGLCEPVAIWSTRRELLEALELDGFTEADLIELETLRWLDATPCGGLAVHDWPDWQKAATKAGWQDYEAARKKAAYVAAKPPSPAPLPPKGEENKGIGKVGGDLRSSPENVESDEEIERRRDTARREMAAAVARLGLPGSHERATA
jgi:hypothetical protein